MPCDRMFVTQWCGFSYTSVCYGSVQTLLGGFQKLSVLDYHWRALSRMWSENGTNSRLSMEDVGFQWLV